MHQLQKKPAGLPLRPACRRGALCRASWAAAFECMLATTARSWSAHRNVAHPPEVLQEASQLECNGLVHLPQRQMLHFSTEEVGCQIESCAPKSLLI